MVAISAFLLFQFTYIFFAQYAEDITRPFNLY